MTTSSSRALAVVLVLLRSRPCRCSAQPAAQPQQQEEFVPIDQLPPQDQLPAAPLLVGAYAFVMLVLFAYCHVGRAPDGDRAAGAGAARIGSEAGKPGLMPTAAHFLYIPGVLLLGIVIGWILGSRAAAAHYVYIPACSLVGDRHRWILGSRAVADATQQSCGDRTSAGPRRMTQGWSKAPGVRRASSDREPLRQNLRQARGDDLRLGGGHVVRHAHHRDRPRRCRACRRPRAGRRRAAGRRHRSSPGTLPRRPARAETRSRAAGRSRVPIVRVEAEDGRHVGVAVEAERRPRPSSARVASRSSKM